MKKDDFTNNLRFLLLPIFLIIASCENVQNYNGIDTPKYTAEYSDSESPKTNLITVVSYNIQHSKRIEKSIDDLYDDDKTTGADIVFLQEMDPGGVETIARRLKYNYIYYPACKSPDYEKDFGNAILSKWPMRDFKKIILPHKDARCLQKRIAVFATVDIGDKEVLACSVHTEFIQSPGKKIDQVEHLANSIDLSHKYVIIGGDFNSFLSYTLNSFDRILAESGFSRATKDIGWTAGVDPLRFPRFYIDHIYTRGFDTMESGKTTSATASDHIPIWTTLRFKI
jgi:endonuclease/exonuclease/phosphatase family metal-dependent hydrolase